MSICTVMIVLNEADYIFQSLMSIYDVVDHIVIVEGATQYAVRDFVSAQGLSTDGTPQLIQAFIDHVDKKKKVKWVRAGWAQTKTNLRNRTLEHVPRGTNYLLKIDGDELYFPQEIKAAVQAMRESDALMATAQHLMFWGSTHRILKPAGHGNQWYVPVLFRYLPGMYYADHVLPQINGLVSYDSDPDRVLSPPELTLYHFGYVGDRRKLVARRWERLRQMQVECGDIPHYRYLQDRDDYGLFLEAISHAKFSNLANIDPQTESIMPYDGPWPEPITRHPFFQQLPKFFGVD